MIEADRYCLDVVNQVEAAAAALREVSGIALESHLDYLGAERHCKAEQRPGASGAWAPARWNAEATVQSSACPHLALILWARYSVGEWKRQWIAAGDRPARSNRGHWQGRLDTDDRGGPHPCRR